MVQPELHGSRQKVLIPAKKAGCKHIFREKVSGAGRERPELVRLLDQLKVLWFDGDGLCLFANEQTSHHDLLQLQVNTLRCFLNNCCTIHQPIPSAAMFSGHIPPGAS